MSRHAASPRAERRPGVTRVRLTAILDRFFRDAAPLAPGDTVMVAFSGGIDSSALLAGLVDLASRRPLGVHAAHVDHGLDAGSADRARRAGRLAAQLGVPFSHRVLAGGGGRGESPEAGARRRRYHELETLRREHGARYLATAHQRDDQQETVLLRLLLGSGWEGMAGIAPRRGHLVRPLLSVPRGELCRVLREAGLEPVEDPSNEDLRVPRNRLRHRVLPALRRRDPDLDERLTALARSAREARRRVAARLERLLEPRQLADGAELDLAALARLPEPLWPPALALLHRTAGAAYPPPGSATAELRRQVEGGGRIRCDCGGEWRWERYRDRLRLAPRRPPAPRFAYELEAPGEVRLEELAVRLRLTRGPVRPWMFQGSPTRAGLGTALPAGTVVTVRNRRPGDRIRPLGCAYSRRLKELLIDRRVPRAERDRLPLLCVGGRIAWVPGVTVDEAFRINDETSVWRVELLEL